MELNFDIKKDEIVHPDGTTEKWINADFMFDHRIYDESDRLLYSNCGTRNGFVCELFYEYDGDLTMVLGLTGDGGIMEYASRDFCAVYERQNGVLATIPNPFIFGFISEE